MSENTNETQVNNEIRLHTIYLKDVSFESPNSPAIFNKINKPSMNLNVTVNSNKLEENTYEVVLGITVDAKMEDKTIFLVELDQAGVFSIAGFGDEDLQQVLGIYCPNILFPYSREAVSNLTTKGGFPPFVIDPINFEALYSQQKALKEKEQ